MRPLCIVFFLASCDTLAVSTPCPQGPLSSADLPCNCQGVTINSLDCGSVSCSSAGPEFSTDSDDCTTPTDTGAAD